MRSNAIKKQDMFKDDDAVARPQPFLKLVEKQQLEYDEQEAVSSDVDYEAFMSQYGIKSTFA